MASRLQYAKEWIEDGDRLLHRGEQRLARFGADPDPIHVEAATQDFSRAAQMYLTAAVEYQQGHERATIATTRLDDTVRLVQSLEGRLRHEAEAAWDAARARLLPSQESHRSSSIEPARTFAESLRERLAHAAPELFDRPRGPEPDRGTPPARGR
jgi:hypothetical protein